MMAREIKRQSNESIELPFDLIIEEILWRLPVKSLLRFRCVNKSWKTLISSPEFAKLHLKRSNDRKNCINNHRLMLMGRLLYAIDYEASNDEDLVTIVDYPVSNTVINTDCRLEILGSCNGLLCVSPTQHLIFLWNPSTRNTKILPISPIKYPDDYGKFISHSYGLGYYPSTDDYKFVRILRFKGETLKVVGEVYSLRTNSWKRIEDFPYDIYSINLCGVHVNGAFHWLVGFQNGLDFFLRIVSLDLAEEKYELVDLPEYNQFCSNIGTLGECLCIYYFSYATHHYDVWVMKEYRVSESWTKFTIPIISTGNLYNLEWVRLCFLKSGEILPVIFGMHGVVIYNTRNRTFRKHLNSSEKMYNAVAYVESLISPNFNNGVVIQAPE